MSGSVDDGGNALGEGARARGALRHVLMWLLGVALTQALVGCNRAYFRSDAEVQAEKLRAEKEALMSKHAEQMLQLQEQLLPIQDWTHVRQDRAAYELVRSRSGQMSYGAQANTAVAADRIRPVHLDAAAMLNKTILVSSASTRWGLRRGFLFIYLDQAGNFYSSSHGYSGKAYFDGPRLCIAGRSFAGGVRTAGCFYTYASEHGQAYLSIEKELKAPAAEAVRDVNRVIGIYDGDFLGAKMMAAMKDKESMESALRMRAFFNGLVEQQLLANHCKAVNRDGECEEWSLDYYVIRGALN